ncbi:MAG TPA: hypothetical protein VIQ02_06220 [Jiangellaceae bacterium]|jgi:hypothetical protein
MTSFARPNVQIAVVRCHCGALVAELWRGGWVEKRRCGHGSVNLTPEQRSTAHV